VNVYNIVLQFFVFFRLTIAYTCTSNLHRERFHSSYLEWSPLICVSMSPLPVYAGYSYCSCFEFFFLSICRVKTSDSWIVDHHYMFLCFQVMVYAHLIWRGMTHERRLSISSVICLQTVCRVHVKTAHDIEKSNLSTKVSGHMWCAKICKL
jgi:hypothetical protein